MKNFLSVNIKLKIISTFIFAFLAFMVVQYFSEQNIRSLKDSETQLIRTKNFKRRIESIESAIITYQSQISNFVLTGNSFFLVGNEDNLSEVKTTLESCKNDPMEGIVNSFFNNYDSLIKSEIIFTRQALTTYNSSDNKNAIALIKTGRSKQLVDEIKETSDQIQQLAENNLKEIITDNNSHNATITQLNYVTIGITIAGILFSILIIFNDINKRTKTENQLRIAQKEAEQSAIIKEQFMANISHEIRTPMNSILGFANILGKSKLDAVQRQHLIAIQTSGETLLKLINDLLDFAKIDSQMMHLEEIPFSPGALIHSINTMFLPKANEKKIELKFNSDVNMPGTVMGDPHRLTQIFINLLDNAIKFTNEGSISIKAELMKESSDNVNLQFSIIDTGIGIPKDKISHIFERFTQAHSNATRKYGGSGLGLSIIKELIEMQGGTISVESAEGFGSKFTFNIPFKKAAVSNVDTNVNNEVKMQIEPTINSMKRVLVAEDNVLNQKLAESLLTEWHFGFDIVENGKEAIEKLEATKYDLVLMDIQMPELNGYDTSQFIREKLKLTVPIIAMTAHALPGEKEKCLIYGMTDYISKPIREIELYNLIAKYINLNQQQEKKEIQPKEVVKNKGVTNLDYLRELSNGNNEFVTVMIDLFLSENPVELQQLESAIIKKDFESIARISHKTKSTITFVGLNLIIEEELNEIESLANRQLDLSKIFSLFSKVKDTCLKAIEELKSENVYQA